MCSEMTSKTIAIRDGFYTRYFGRDCFLQTDKTRRTDALAKEFIEKIYKRAGVTTQSPTEAEIKYIKARMDRRQMIVTEHSGGWWDGLKDITFRNEWATCGCDACADPFEVCYVV